MRATIRRFDYELSDAVGRNDSDTVKASVVFAYHGASNHALPGTRSAASEDIALG